MLSKILNRALSRAPQSSACLRQLPVASTSVASQHHHHGASQHNLLRGNASNQKVMYSSLATRMNGSNKLFGRVPSTQPPTKTMRRTNFSYAGPKRLSDILKTELLEDKSSAEIVRVWLRLLCLRIDSFITSHLLFTCMCLYIVREVWYVDDLSRRQRKGSWIDIG